MTEADMPRVVRQGLIAMAAIALSGCRGQERFTRTAQADFVEVRSEYTVVLAKPSFMEAALGSDWESQSLYFSPPAFSPECQRIMGQRPPWRPRAKGDAVFVVACTGWEDGTAFLYSVEKGQSVTLRINLRAHTMSADAPTKPNSPPTLLPDGRMVFY
jgi:hypothetical protein